MDAQETARNNLLLVSALADTLHELAEKIDGDLLQDGTLDVLSDLRERAEGCFANVSELAPNRRRGPVIAERHLDERATGEVAALAVELEQPPVVRVEAFCGLGDLVVGEAPDLDRGVSAGFEPSSCRAVEP